MGGNGNDSISGGVGDDSISGGNGRDELYGGESNDVLGMLLDEARMYTAEFLNQCKNVAYDACASSTAKAGTFCVFDTA